MKKPEVECVWSLGAMLAEGPLWSPREGILWFVDIKGQRIHACSESGGAQLSFETAEFAAFVFRDRRGGMLCGLRTGLYRFDPVAATFTPIIRVEENHPGNRLNDGYVDTSGRLWFGTMDNDHQRPTGALYCFTGGSLRRMDHGYVITNGPAMSPDGRTLYHVDTAGQCVYAFDVHADGALSRKRLFVKVEDPEVYPDGPAVDSLGNVWVAMWGGWGVRCYSPVGELLDSIQLPVSQCTKVAFGGPDLRTLYITTASIGLSPELRMRQPLAGGLFRVRVEVPGLPPNEFAG